MIEFYRDTCTLQGEQYCPKCKACFCPKCFRQFHEELGDPHLVQSLKDRDLAEIGSKAKAKHIRQLIEQCFPPPIAPKFEEDLQNKFFVFDFPDTILRHHDKSQSKEFSHPTNAPKMLTLIRDTPLILPMEAFSSIMKAKSSSLPVVCMVGPTGAGKSTLIRAMCPADGRKPIADSLHQSSSTTKLSCSSDLNAYEAIVADMEMMVIDSEGIEGADRPQALDARWQSSDPEILKRRKTIVTEAYPKLLFAVSHVFCFVFDRASSERGYVIRLLRDYGRTACARLTSQPSFPSLIIVFNNHNGKVETDVDKASEEWLGIDSALSDELKLYYFDIKVIYIPTLSTDSTEAHFELFAGQVRALQDCICKSLRSYQERTRQLFPTSRPHQFGMLKAAVRLINQDQNAHLDLLSLYVQLKPPSSLADQLVAFFTLLRSSHKEDLHLRHVQALSCLKELLPSIYVTWHRRITEHPDQPDGLPLPSQIAPAFEDLLRKAQHLLDELALCKATYSFPGIGMVTCEETVLNHGPSHTSSHTYTDTSSDSKGPTPCRWPSNGVVSSPETCDLVQPLREAIEREGKDFGQKAAPIKLPAILLPYVSRVNFCPGCFMYPPSVFGACGHNTCMKCFLLGQCAVCGATSAYPRSERYFVASSKYQIEQLDSKSVDAVSALWALWKNELKSLGWCSDRLPAAFPGLGIDGDSITYIPFKDMKLSGSLPSAICELGSLLWMYVFPPSSDRKPHSS
jgi:hypothetical protein